MKSLLLIVISILLSVSAQGEVVQFRYTGVVDTGRDIEVLNDIRIGDPFVGTISFDLEVIDTNDSAVIGNYLLSSVSTIEFPTVAFSAIGTQQSVWVKDSDRDELVFSSNDTLANDFLLDYFRVEFTDFTGTAFNDDSLPSSLSLVDFTVSRFQLFGLRQSTSEGVSLIGSLTSLHQVAVPEDLEGDFNMDGDVDGHDFMFWQRYPSIGELAQWQANYGEILISPIHAVPEPAPVMLVLSGLTPAMRRCRWTRRRN